MATAAVSSSLYFNSSAALIHLWAFVQKGVIMCEEDVSQSKQESGLHRRLRELESDIKRRLDNVVQEIKTDASSGICRVSAAVACFVATLSLLYALFNLITAYVTGAAHFELSIVGTSFGKLYLAGWVGSLVSFLVGIMLVSAAISFVRKSKGVICVLGAILTVLLLISYLMLFFFVGDLGAFVNNELINPFLYFIAQVLVSLSLDPYVFFQNMIKGIPVLFCIPYIVFPLLIWFSGNAKPQLIISLKALLCIHVLFRIVLWVADNINGIVWFLALALIAALALWLFSGGSDSGDHSIYVNDLGDKIRIKHIRKQ